AVGDDEARPGSSSRHVVVEQALGHGLVGEVLRTEVGDDVAREAGHDFSSRAACGKGAARGHANAPAVPLARTPLARAGRGLRAPGFPYRSIMEPFGTPGA